MLQYKKFGYNPTNKKKMPPAVAPHKLQIFCYWLWVWAALYLLGAPVDPPVAMLLMSVVLTTLAASVLPLLSVFVGIGAAKPSARIGVVFWELVVFLLVTATSARRERRADYFDVRSQLFVLVVYLGVVRFYYRKTLHQIYAVELADARRDSSLWDVVGDRVGL